MSNVGKSSKAHKSHVQKSSSVLPRHIQDIGPSTSTAVPEITPADARTRISSAALNLGDAIIDIPYLEQLPQIEAVPHEVIDAKTRHETNTASTAGAGPAPTAAAAKKAASVLADRLELSAKIIAEEDGPLDMEKLEQFRTLQHEVIESGDMTRMPELMDLLLDLNHLSKKDVEAGFKESGAKLSYRNTLGSLIGLLPLILVFEMSREKYKHDPTMSSVLSGAYMVATIAAVLAGASVNSRALIQGTPFVDAACNGAPDIAPELAQTPSYLEIKKELEDLHARVKDDSGLKSALEAFRKDPGNAELKAAVEGELDRADQADLDAPGKKHFYARAQLHLVYIKGYQIQASLQTGKAIGNFGAGWAGFFTNPRVAAYVQIATTLTQIVGQRVVAPNDQVRLQSLMWELEIMSRKLTGDDETDAAIVKGMVRTPLKVRATSLEGLTTNYNERMEQTISGILQKADPSFGATDGLAEFRDYTNLHERAVHPQRLAALGATVQSGIERLTAAEGASLTEQLAQAQGKQRDGLIAQIADKLGMPAPQYRQLLDLSAKPFDKLSETEQHQLDDALNAATVARDGLTPDEQYEISGFSGHMEQLKAATMDRDFQRERELCDQIAGKLGIPAADVREFHYLGTHPVEPLDEDEQAALATLTQKVDSARAKVAGNKKQLAALNQAEQKYAEIRLDPVHIKERRFGDVSTEHADLVRDGMQVTRNEGFFKIKPETGMLLKDGHKRAGNAPELISNLSANLRRSLQSFGLSGVNSSLMLNAGANFGISLAKALSKDPANFQSPWWPKVITTGIWLGAWGVNSLAAHRVGEAKVAPLGFWDQVCKFGGVTSPFAETILQVDKLDLRTKLRADASLQRRGVREIGQRYLTKTMFEGFKGLNVVWKNGVIAKDTTAVFNETMTTMAQKKQERTQIRQQLQASASAANKSATGKAPDTGNAG